MRKIDSKEFKRRVEIVHGSRIRLLQEYTTCREKVRSECKICGHIWLANPRPLANGTGCPQCGKIKAASVPKWPKAAKEFSDKVKSIHGSKFSIITEYKNLTQPIKVLCNNCKNSFTTKPLNLLNKKHGGRKFCGRKNKGLKARKSDEFFKAQIKSLRPNIRILDSYTTCRQRIQVTCKKCHHTWKPQAGRLLRRGCPMCFSSKGETRIRELLENNDIDFTPQYTFEDLVGQRNAKLRFDFGITERGTLLYLIEYDGEQHFKPVKAWGGATRLKRQIELDNIKTEYCRVNNIKLIRIAVPVKDLTLEMFWPCPKPKKNLKRLPCCFW